MPPSTFASRQPDHGATLRWALVLAPLLLLLGTLSGRFAGSAESSPWFEGLVKPDFYPPGWAFGVVWTILYLMIGVAAAFVAASRERGRGAALLLFAVQFAMNLAWSPLFFRAHAIGASVALIVALLVVAIVTAWAFAAVRRVAGLLMLPYLLWVAFASVLDGRIWALNRDGSRFVENRPVDVPLAQE